MNNRKQKTYDTRRTRAKSRQPISKRLRFEVLKRDSFSCRYCGAKSPEVFLVVDHIHPVVYGGKSDLINLTASCEPCNQGKRTESVVSIIRPLEDCELAKVESIFLSASTYPDERVPHPKREDYLPRLSVMVKQKGAQTVIAAIVSAVPMLQPFPVPIDLIYQMEDNLTSEMGTHA